MISNPSQTVPVLKAGPVVLSTFSITTNPATQAQSINFNLVGTLVDGSGHTTVAAQTPVSIPNVSQAVSAFPAIAPLLAAMIAANEAFAVAYAKDKQINGFASIVAG